MDKGNYEVQRSLSGDAQLGQKRHTHKRTGKFTAAEVVCVRNAVREWTDSHPEVSLENIKWAKDSKLYGVWERIAELSGLHNRTIISIRACALRRVLPGSDKKRWSAQETREFIEQQQALGLKSWKAIALSTGRTLEDVCNKGAVVLGRSRNSLATRAAAQTAAVRSLETRAFNSVELHVARLGLAMNAPLNDSNGGRRVFFQASFLPWNSYEKDLKADSGINAITAGYIWHRVILPFVIERVMDGIGAESVHEFDIAILKAIRRCMRGSLRRADGSFVTPPETLEQVPWVDIVPMWPAHFTKAYVQKHQLIAPHDQSVDASMDRYIASLTPETNGKNSKPVKNGILRDDVFRAYSDAMRECLRSIVKLAA